MKQKGPGEWHSIHVTGAWANTPERREFFNSWVRNQINNLDCKTCRDHANNYVKANPPERASDPFIWSWEFHNAVNRRLGKPEMDYNTAKKMYLDGEVKNCNAGCGDEDQSNGQVGGQVGGQTQTQDQAQPNPQDQAQPNPQDQAQSNPQDQAQSNPQDQAQPNPQDQEYVIRDKPQNTLTFRHSRRRT